MDGLHLLFESLQSEMEVDDLRRNLIASRILVRGVSTCHLKYHFVSLTRVTGELRLSFVLLTIIIDRTQVRLFRAPSLKGERAKYVSSIVMSCLCRLELTTRRRCEEESEFQGLLSNMLVSVLSRTNTFRLHAHHISVCLQKMIYLSSTLKQDITSALIALVQHRPRQLCCCLAVYVLISRF